MRDWRLLVIAGLVVLVAILCWRVGSLAQSNAGLSARMRQLETASAQASAHQVAAEKVECARRAGERFQKLGYADQKAGWHEGNLSATYQSHHNPTLSRCLMTVETTNITAASEIVQRFLVDVDEQREFAEYSWVSSNAKLASDQPPIICRLIPSATSESKCRSDGEYKAFVARYME